MIYFNNDYAEGCHEAKKSLANHIQPIHRFIPPLLKSIANERLRKNQRRD